MPHTSDPTGPLLEQARARLQAALAAEREARRDVELPATGVTWDHVSAAQRETRQAQGWLDQVERSRGALPGALAEARRDVVWAESALTQVEAQARQRIARARREVDLAREAVERLEQAWLTLAGT